MKKNKEYWYCQIGPIEKNKVPYGGDYPLRCAVENKFIKMFGIQSKVCLSGWGLTEEMKSRLNMINNLKDTDSTGKIMRKIDRILNNHQKKLIKMESRLKTT